MLFRALASFADPGFHKLLAAYDIALVVSDNPGKWPVFKEVTASFLYLRMHGSRELYASGYSRRSLASWAEYIRSARPSGRGRRAQQRPAYVYFDNDAKVMAPPNARLLQRLLVEQTQEPTQLRRAV